MKSSTKDVIKGNMHKVNGKIKETAGKVFNDSKLEAKGKAEVVSGKIQEAIGKAENKTGRK